ncbi:MAG: leucyl aminopeptidase [Planctomycetota bacterium]|jgi:leucyl aminopeptidase
MKIRLLAPADKKPTDLLVVLAFEGAAPDAGSRLNPFVSKAKATGDLTTELRKVSLFYPDQRTGAGGARRLACVGMGKRREITAERLRRAAAVAQKRAEALAVKAFRLQLHEQDHREINADVAGRAIAEGLILGAYKYQPPSGTKAKPRAGQVCEVVYTGKAKKSFKDGFDVGRIGANATAFARDLENMPGNLATPTVLAREARKLHGSQLKVRVLDERDMKRLKMGALLGVTRGSKEPAKLIILDYHPRGAKKTICIVGKGLTFDTGGISIKPSAKMDEMRYDMCGGGAVLGLFHAISNGGLRGIKGNVRVVGLVPSSENMPGAAAQKPGDVVTACDGTTIEVLNTDAEGRLILADALAYAAKTYKPAKMINLATLTGAVVVALGHEMAGIMGNDEILIHELIDAGQEVDEPLWQLPLWEVHREQTKSKFADVANLNSPAHGNGSTAGGAFLSYFVGKIPWAHLDIAGSAWGAQAKDYYTHGAAGTAVRTLLCWVRGLK